MESLLLIALHSQAPHSTLRITNQIFSVLVVLLLLKLKPAIPGFIHARRETFGIYLIHPFTLILGRKAIAFAYSLLTGQHLLGNSVFASRPILACLFWALTFVLVYGSALLATKALITLGMGSLVGNQKPKAVATLPKPAREQEMMPAAA
jgi:hypothetical protein